ncbi:SpvB/TcaC N-terminal domain-containing protein [uncultured Gimesia sp.]|uniref:SpvB/TcaC N-terminal domain-containing protein n=1 Tax=uncultured Gimesia sp. TaxID=1678688 RepID=UPI0030D753E4|tara:strand:+ start:82332 stop:88847 length:6516 start_codon:yes stop_codon:yes gene_type:complete
MQRERAASSSTKVCSFLSLTVASFLVWIIGYDVVVAQTSQPKGITLQRLSLPRGPGSIEGLGESFESDLATGSARYSIQFDIPPAAGGFAPSLTLSYDSNLGVDLFGLGWSLFIDSVQRQTDKGIPRYGEMDTFICAGEELVQVKDGSFFAENCKDYARYRRLGNGWEKILPSGVKLIFGEEPHAREHRPSTDDFDGTFRWLLSSSVDLNGNRIEYFYKELPESEGVKCLSQIRYGFQDSGSTNYHEIVFDYEKSRAPSTSFVSRFRRTIGHRCRQVKVNTIVDSAATNIRNYVFQYHETARVPLIKSVIQSDVNGTELPPLRFQYLPSILGNSNPGELAFEGVKIHIPAHLRQEDIALCDLNRDGLPDICYSVPDSEWRYLLNEGNMNFSKVHIFKGIPTSLSLRDPKTQLVDINGDGRIDLATTVPNDEGDQRVAYYEITKSLTNASGIRRSEIEFRHPEIKEGAKRIFSNTCSIDLTTEGVRLFDIDFNKCVDFARILDDSFLFATNKTEPDGSRKWHEEKVHFSDSNFPNNTVSPTMRLVDVNGDRLMDFVDMFERDGTIRITCYYGTGDGQFGTGQLLQFITGDQTSDIGEFPTSNLATFHFADINADGLSDLVHVIPGNVRVWPSRGEFFEEPIDWRGPNYRSSAQILLQDMNGNGSTDIVCIDPEVEDEEQLKVLDCFPPGRGNLLSQITNGIGKQVDLKYRPLTDYYLGSLASKHPWHSFSPLPLHVVSRISRSNSLDLDQDGQLDSEVTNIIYAEPFYDGREKQFRGFAHVTRIEWGDNLDESQSGTATTVTRHYFHTGAPDGIDNDQNDKTDEFNHIAGAEEEPLKGRLLWEEICGIAAIEHNQDYTASWPLKSGANDDYDNNSNGEIDESNEQIFAHNDLVYRRRVNEWKLRRLYDENSAPPLNNHHTKDKLRIIRDAHLAVEHVQYTEGPNVVKLEEIERARFKPRVVRKTFKFNEFGGMTEKVEYGVIFPADLRDSPRKQIIEYAHQGSAIQDWILDRVARTTIQSEVGNIVSGERTFYGDQTDKFDTHPLFQLKSRVLKIRTERLLLPDSQKGISPERINNNDLWVQRSVEGYDKFGNVSWILDGEGNPAVPKDGHSRNLTYDPIFNAFPVSETIFVGAEKQLRAKASFDIAFGVITELVDFTEDEPITVQDSVAGNPIGGKRSVKGKKTTIKYDSHARLSALIRPDDSSNFPTVSYTYIPADPINKLQYVYDENGGLNLLTVSDSWTVPLGINNGNVSLVSGLSAVVTQKRENAGNEATVGSVTFTDGFNRSIAKINENTHDQNLFLESVLLDSRGNPSQIFQPHEQDGWSPISIARRQQIKRDPLNRIVSTSHPKDANNFVASSLTHFLPLTERRYDEEDNRSGSKHEGTFTDLVQDGFERLVKVVEHVRLTDDGEQSAKINIWPTTYGYDLLDNLTKITDAQNNISYHHYDSLSRRRKINDPDRGKSTYDYDLAGNQTQKKDARGSTINIKYDGANRKLTETGTYNGSVETISFHYDTSKPGLLDMPGNQFTPKNCLGRLTWVKDLAGEEHHSYSARGLVNWTLRRFNAEGENRVYVRSEKFDSQDRRIQQNLTSHDSDPLTIVSRYNKRGLTKAFEVNNASIVEFDYHPNGVVRNTKYANKTKKTTELDHRLRLRSLRISKPAGGTQQDLIHNNYTYDQVSNILRIDDLRPTSVVPFNDPRRNTQVFSLDDAYRLRSASYVTGPPDVDATTSVAFKFDRIGNRLEKTASGVLPNDEHWKRGLGKASYATRSNQNGAVATQSGPHAMLSSDQGSNLKYDESGAATQYDEKELTRDAWGRITQVTDAGNTIAKYRYSHRGNRLLKVTEDRVYYPFKEVRDSTATGLRHYLLNGSERLVCYTNGQRRFHHYDHINSMILSTADDASKLEEIAYLPYGAIRNITKDAQNTLSSTFRFSGKERDEESGLIYFQARYMNSSIGSFFESDPLLFSSKHSLLTMPLSKNPYSYGLANPNAFIDPDGKHPLVAILVLVGLELTNTQAANAPGPNDQAVSTNTFLGTVGNVAGTRVVGALVSWVGKTFSRVSPKAIGPITGYSRHGLHRAIGRDGGRGVSSRAMLNAAKNPSKILEQSRGTTMYKTKKATIVLNKDGKIVSTWGKARGPQIWSKGTTRPSGGGAAQRKANQSGFSYNPNLIKD